MSKFKVGDRVWVKEHKKYGVIESIGITTKNGCEIPYYTLDSGFNYLDEDLNQTAQTMFEALGYEKKLEDSSYIIYNYHNYEDGYITELRIDKEKNKYKLTNFTNNNQAFSAWGDKLLHLAIHQKMIELGWFG